MSRREELEHSLSYIRDLKAKACERDDVPALKVWLDEMENALCERIGKIIDNEEVTA